MRDVSELLALREGITEGEWRLEMEAKWPFDLAIEPNILEMRRIAYSTRHQSLDDVHNAAGFPPNERTEVMRSVAEQEANARAIAAVPELFAAIEAQAREIAALTARAEAAEAAAAQHDKLRAAALGTLKAVSANLATATEALEEIADHDSGATAGVAYIAKTALAEIGGNHA